MLGRRKDGQFTLAVTHYSRGIRSVTLERLGPTGIIRELKHCKLRVHKSMDIVISWGESVNESTIDQKCSRVRRKDGKDLDLL